MLWTARISDSVEIWFWENEPERLAATLGPATNMYHKVHEEGNVLQRLPDNTNELAIGPKD